MNGETFESKMDDPFADPGPGPVRFGASALPVDFQAPVGRFRRGPEQRPRAEYRAPVLDLAAARERRARR